MTGFSIAHQTALTRHLSEELAGEDQKIAVLYSKFARSLKGGLTNVAISVGADAEIDYETKGQLLSIISLMSNSVSQAYETNIQTKQAKAQLETLSR